ncbi:MAG: 4-phosphoerythronate dehydrogenase [Proteobacteria bacterium]|nr:4-phosphoerythronate dehydrogenase [Pseudomonadota bacterium]
MSNSLSIVADQQILFAKEAFSTFGDVSLVDGRSIDRQTIKDSDVLLVRSVTPVNESLLKNSEIRFVGSATSGIDHVDQDYLKKSDIQFVYAPGSNARSVAEYVLSALFAVAELNDFALTDKTVGIIGHGQVGSRLSHFLNILGIKCLLNDPPLAELDSDNIYQDLEEVLTADIVTLHVPLVTDGPYPTRQLVNNEFLAKLKSDVILINTSRGEVINENTLLDFKMHNPDSTLILDVWCNEPGINRKLLKETLIATPHIAGYSLDGKLKATHMLVDSLQQFLNNNIEIPRNNLPEPAHIKLELGEGSIQCAVMQSYDIRSDAVGLRNLFTLEENERDSYFDNLRKHYPNRREFKVHTIKSQMHNMEMETKLEQLGFNVEII